MSLTVTHSSGMPMNDMPDPLHEGIDEEFGHLVAGDVVDRAVHQRGSLASIYDSSIVDTFDISAERIRGRDISKYACTCSRGAGARGDFVHCLADEFSHCLALSIVVRAIH